MKMGTFDADKTAAQNADGLGIPLEGEGFRLVIWDLDETFWRGTHSEGGVTEFIQQNEKLVIELASRGIMNSICSKNAFVEVKQILEQRALWQYFVFPSIDWSPKGPRVAGIISDMQLRPATVLFIDDNFSNRAEATAFTPGLTAVSEKEIVGIVDHPRFKGKNDVGLTRLKQYQVLEQRKIDANIAGADNLSFLASSAIKVVIDYDVEAHIDRAVELVNRTNQLNFTKLRLPEDIEAARSQLLDAIRPRWVWAGLVRVSDRYGDYGYVGFFLGHGVEQKQKQLKHFCFSCRTLGMGIEKYVYQELGSPALKVSGEVLVDIFQGDQVDWINRSADDQSGDDNQAFNKFTELRLRGGCDLDPILHYCGKPAVNILRETNFVYNHTFIRYDTISMLHYGIDDPGPALWDDITLIGLDRSIFETRFFDPVARGALLILSVWGDTYIHHYRHKKTGCILGFTPGVTSPREAHFKLREQPDADLTEYLGPFDPSKADARAATEKLVRGLAEHFEFVGEIDLDLFRTKLEAVLSRVPEGCRVVMVQPPLRDRSVGSRSKNAHPRLVAFREATSTALRQFAFARVVDIETCVHDDTEVSDFWHFDRMVYFRLFQAVQAELREEEGAWPVK